LHSLLAKNEASKREGPGEKAKRKKDYRIITDAIFWVLYNQERSLTLLMQNQKQGKSGLRVNFI